MKIALIGEYSGNPDEGMKNVAFYLAQGLSEKGHDVIKLDLKSLYRGFWGAARKFQPEIVHYVPGPTLASILVARMVACLSNRARVVMSTPHPSLPSWPLTRVVSLLRPDLVLAQSPASENLFRRLGCKTRFVPFGVDVDRFVPVSEETKGNLRKRYGIDPGSWVVLHAGHLAKGRNLEFFNDVDGDSQVLIIASTSVRAQSQLQHTLEASGCIVWRRYLPNMEHIYAMSDCYVFPTMDRIGAAEIPISVLEAMSCNLPVVTTRFGGLPQLFAEGHGLCFADSAEQLHRQISAMRDFKAARTREKVLPYSWRAVTDRLERIYEELITRTGPD